MNFTTSLNNIVLAACLAASLTACGGSSSSSPTPEPPIVVDPIEEVPTNTIKHAYFRDQDSASGKLGGSITLEVSATEATQPFKTESVWIYWADANGNKLDGTASIAWLKTESFKSESDSTFNIVIPTGTRIPENTQSSSQALILYPHNGYGEAEKGTLIKFHDFIGNSELSGPGGNEYFPW
jgi:hypothetical protein